MAQQTLRVTSGPAAGTTIQLNGDLVFGRDAGDSGSLGGDPEISRQHARITAGANGEAVVEDLGSTNGTFVNGQRISSPTPLRPGDSLELGGSTLQLAQQVPRPGTTPPPVGTTPLPSGLPSADHPATSKGGVKPGFVAAAAIVGLLIGGAIAAAIWGGDESTAAEPFSLMAEGWSAETIDPESSQREIVITMKTFESPHGIEELRVHKYLDETTPPPQRTYDAMYTFSAQNGDTLVFSAAGDVTEPEGPDAFFGQTFEQWRVVEGTGIFEGARGEGTITTAVDVAGRGPAEAPTGSNVVKHIQGTLQLDD
jgi:pSer/pThr/pTyr-binding forkhead associated (FHA) protein